MTTTNETTDEVLPPGIRLALDRYRDALLTLPPSTSEATGARAELEAAILRQLFAARKVALYRGSETMTKNSELIGLLSVTIANVEADPKSVDGWETICNALSEASAYAEKVRRMRARLETKYPVKDPS